MELLRILASAGAGFIMGICFGYVVGADNGFVKGCNWAYYNSKPKKEGLCNVKI